MNQSSQRLPGKGKRLLIIVNEDWFFVSHRLPIALEAARAGYDVHVAANESEAAATIRKAGLTFHPLSVTRSGRSPVAELRGLLSIAMLIRRVRPDLAHLVTVKPALYGSMAARAMQVPAVVAIPGLGHGFTERGFLKHILTLLYRLALGGRSRHHIVVQNQSDAAALTRMLDLPSHRLTLIPGSGVCLDDYPMTPERPGRTLVVMASRLLKDKGVLEFIEAARLIRSQRPEVGFLLAGDPDPGNPSSLTESELEAIRQEGWVEVHGYERNIPTLFQRCHLVVLPSYREGLPKVLIEASACGRAIVTTDAPGCREAILPGETGLLVQVRDAEGLAQAILKLVDDPALRAEMGAQGRCYAESQFDIRQVIETHLRIYEETIREGRRH